MDEMKLDGHGPFVMPLCQSARAFAEGGAVVVHIRVLTNPHQEGTIVLRMTPGLAVDLAGNIAEASGFARR